MGIANLTLADDISPVFVMYWKDVSICIYRSPRPLTWHRKLMICVVLAGSYQYSQGHRFFNASSNLHYRLRPNVWLDNTDPRDLNNVNVNTPRGGYQQAFDRLRRTQRRNGSTPTYKGRDNRDRRWRWDQRFPISRVTRRFPVPPFLQEDMAEVEGEESKLGECQ